MSSLTTKRYYRLRILLGIIALGLIYMGSKRIFSYNIGASINPNMTSTTKIINATNSIDPFDDTIVHTIFLDMSTETYNKMLQTYTETSEKEFFETNITIDGVTIEKVGVRLKGNSSLRGLGGGGGGGMGGGFGSGNMMTPPEMEDRGNAGFQQPGTGGMDSGMMQMNMGGDMQGSGGAFGGMGSSSTGYLPLMIKFDEYVAGQTYQGLSEISLRVGGFSDTTLMAEMIAYRIYQSLGLPAPRTVYTKVTVGELESQLFILSELVDETYLENYYPGDNGILYKNTAFYDFSYINDDPTSYDTVFSQKTNKNKDDMNQLIKLIKFVNNSTDEEFDKELDEYIDVDSVLYIMAIDHILQSNDSFNNGRSNYYLYYHKEQKRFTILTRDQNLAFGGLGGGMGGGGGGGMGGGMGFGGGNRGGRTQNGTGSMMSGGAMRGRGGFGSGGAMGNSGGGGMGGGIGGGNGNNIFRNRLLKSEKYQERYKEIFDEVHNEIFSGKITQQIDELSSVFLERNKDEQLVESATYQTSLTKLQSTLTSRQTLTATESVTQLLELGTSTTTGAVAPNP